MRSRTILAVVLVLLAVGVVVTIALNEGGGDGPAAIESSPVAGEAREADAPTVAFDVAANEGSAADSDLRMSIVENAPVVELVLDDATPGFLVRCVDAATGAPIAGAHVYLSDRELPGTLDNGSHPTPIEALITHREPQVANTRGEVRLPPPLTSGLLAAVDGDHRAARFVGPPLFEDVIELRLEPRRDLVIEVRHADGSPASGFDVVLNAWRQGARAGSEHFSGGITRIETDADGRATLEWHSLRASTGIGAAVRVEVEVDLVTRDPVAVAFDLGDPLVEPFQLTLPPVGQVAVQVATPSGPVGRGAWTAYLGPEGGSRSRVRSAPVVDGRAEFRVAATSERFAAELDRRPDLSAAGGAFFLGPAQHGEEVVIEVPLAGVQVVGRLTDELGGPIGDEACVAYPVASREQAISPGTDADGWFAAPWSQFLVSGAKSHEPVEWVFEVERSSTPPLRGSALITKFAHDSFGRDDHGEYDIGEIVMFEAPLLVSGVVVDTLGRRVPNVQVVIEAVGPEALDRDPVTSARTNASGQFWVPLRDVLTERIGGRPLVASVVSDAHASVGPEEFRAGAELTLTIEGVAVIEGRIEASATHAFTGFSVVGTPRDAWKRRAEFDVELDAGGRFRAVVPAGIWSLELFSRTGGGFGTGSLWYLGRIDGIEARAGRTVRPPSLNPWSIEVEPHTVQVFEPDGQPVRMGYVTWVHPGGVTALGRIFEGSLEVHATTGTVDAWIQNFDCAGLFVRDMRSQSSITLEPAPAIAVHVQAPDLELPAGAELGLELEFDLPFEGGGALNASVRWDDATDGFRHWFKVLHAVGEWRTRLFVRRDRASPALEFGKAHTVVVFSGAEPQQTSITLDSDEVAEALRVLEEQER
ncbi:hypothetical protein Pla163_06420 [Planctomycetes bacterium Pla163]|uniref:Nickel uptake substrate-specific transmembrane region n=1 Tax=Rohdeia mirabilis TaxID=2528008 RepID=A0A518CWF3_9BACT|nr:hypothetical protein Pla163_06420 [Planctomycetes bacterium Pla163]